MYLRSIIHAPEKFRVILNFYLLKHAENTLWVLKTWSTTKHTPKHTRACVLEGRQKSASERRQREDLIRIPALENFIPVMPIRVTRVCVILTPSPTASLVSPALLHSFISYLLDRKYVLSFLESLLYRHHITFPPRASIAYGCVLWDQMTQWEEDNKLNSTPQLRSELLLSRICSCRNWTRFQKPLLRE